MNHTHTETDLPIENEYPKLIRDNIPGFVERDGRIAETRILTDPKEILHFLLAKLVEESTELAEAESIDHQKEELADVYEVLENLGSTLGISREEITITQDSKRQERGGFNNHILMTSKPQ